MNGCTGVPNTLFNEAACNIHDLCYITPGATKKECDDTFVDNIVRVYCDNVNVLERLACTGRAQLAGAVVSAIDSFYDDSAETRATCSRTVKITQPWIVAFILTLVVGALVPLVIKRKGDATVEIGFEETILSEEKVEEIVENNDEIVDEISNEFEGKAVVGKVDVDNNHEFAAKFGVRNIPTVLLFKNGELIDRKVGVSPKSVYVSAIEEHL